MCGQRAQTRTAAGPLDWTGPGGFAFRIAEEGEGWRTKDSWVVVLCIADAIIILQPIVALGWHVEEVARLLTNTPLCWVCKGCPGAVAGAEGVYVVPRGSRSLLCDRVCLGVLYQAATSEFRQ